jgi:hypothetical protein
MKRWDRVSEERARRYGARFSGEKGITMKPRATKLLAALLCCVGREAVAAENETVFAVAKVDGKTKMIDGHIYHLVAIKLDARIWLQGTGLGSPVLAVEGNLGKTALADGDKERDMAERAGGVEMLWLRLPEKGEIEVVWGALSDPKESATELRDRLVKAGYKSFKIEVRKIPVVKADGKKELSAALDRLAKSSEGK